MGVIGIAHCYIMKLVNWNVALPIILPVMNTHTITAQYLKVQWADTVIHSLSIDLDIAMHVQ